MSKFVKLNSGNTIPTIALGTYLIDNHKTSKLVYEALKVGYRHFDTAVLYGNEREVGLGIYEWLKEDPKNNKREEVFYTTKLWNSQGGYSNAKKAIKECLEKVKELEYIDLVLIHSPMLSSNPKLAPQKRLETWKALQEAVDSGKVKNIGVSNYGQRHIEQLLAYDELKYLPAVNQIEISPWIMRQELADFCKSKGIAVEAYAPLNHGGRFRDPTLLKIAEKYHVTVAQVLIRWSVQKGYIPLPKTKTIERLASNLDVFSFELSDAEMSEISHPDAYEPSDWECTDCP